MYLYLKLQSEAFTLQFSIAVRIEAVLDRNTAAGVLWTVSDFSKYAELEHFVTEIAAVEFDLEN